MTASFDGSDRVLLEGDLRSAIVADGHLVYARGDTLMAHPLDRDTMKLTAKSFPLADSIGRA
jgi:hypothetical protein